MSSELLQNVRCLDATTQTDRSADVLVINGKIQAVDDRILEFPSEAQVRDCTGLVLAPGLVDLYSSGGEPGFESRETLDSLCQSALAGGVTRLALLPDLQPATDNPGAVSWLRSRLHAIPQLQMQLWGAMTLGTQGEQMVELADLADGVAGFADGKPLQNWALVRRLLEYAQPLDRPLMFFCCDRSLNGNGVVREGFESIRLGLPGSPTIAETAPLAALLECVATIPTPIHIMRVSTARGVALIRAARAQGLPVTASTTWMHLLLSINDVQSYDPSLRLNPPLGNPDDRLALIQGLQDGTLDAIAIDHTPYTYEEKTVAFAEAPPGAIGLELALPLLWQELVEQQQVSPLALWQWLSANPARCLGQAPPRLAAGQPAEMLLFDPQTTWTVLPSALKSQATNTPWLNRSIRGRVVQTWA